jgi:hypothetical protein
MTLRGKWLQGVALLVSFDALLRSAELRGLVKEDVTAVDDHRVDMEDFRGVGLRLQRCKTGQNQFVTIERDCVKTLLAEVLNTTAPGARLFPFSAGVMRYSFKISCGELGISGCGYVLHSLRHGGATSLAMRGVPVNDILLRGRWAATKSAAIYVQSGRALLLSVSVPAVVSQLASFLLPDVVSAMLSAREMAPLA